MSTLEKFYKERLKTWMRINEITIRVPKTMAQQILILPTAMTEEKCLHNRIRKSEREISPIEPRLAA